MKKITLIFCLLTSFKLWAQSDLTLYHMDPLPQKLYVNPSLTPDNNGYIGMPALSSIAISLNSNAFKLKGFSDALTPITDTTKPDNVGYSLDITALGDMFSKNTFVNGNMSQEWLAFGFRLHKSYFHFNASEKVKGRLSVPSDIVKLAFQGNGDQNLGYEFDLSLALDVNHYREFAFGYQRSFINDRLSVGGRIKYLYGITDVTTTKSNLRFHTDPESFAYRLTSDIEVNASSNFIGNDTFQPVNLLFGGKNKGWGLDLGGSFKLTDKLTLSASIIDLGQITWKQNTNQIKSKNPGAEFTFKGLDIAEYFTDSTTIEDGLQEVADSVIDVFSLEVNQGQVYKAGLHSEFYLGGTYQVLRNHRAGALLYGSFYNKQLYPALTLSWNSKFGRVLGLSVSYTMSRGSFSNLGAGIAFNGGPEQFYLTSDNIIGAATTNVRNVSLRFGWNHTFGRKKFDEKQKEKAKEQKGENL